MTLLATLPNPQAAGQLVLAMVLAVAGFVLLLPQPRGRWVAGGTAALVAAAAVLGAWVHQEFGDPAADWIGKLLFILFSSGAIGFGVVLVVQRNPARGAIAFAFVILSTCGLFLLLAAPFLMAATIIIYAGAIIVTFLFVLMLSFATGPSDENDRSREPLLGSLAGFAFVGLVLFALYQTAGPSTAATGEPEPGRLPAPVLTPDERVKLLAAADKLTLADTMLAEPNWTGRRVELDVVFEDAAANLESVIGRERPGRVESKGSISDRLKLRVGAGDEPTGDIQAVAVSARVADLRAAARRVFYDIAEDNLTGFKPNIPAARAEIQGLRDGIRVLAGASELPARNVANIGLVLYADHLLAVELAGTLLLVATIGAVAIAHRKGTTA